MRKNARPAPVPFIPPLSAEELALLRDSPYDEPNMVRGTRAVKLAQVLIDRGLLERDPTASRMVVRCTEQGIDAARPLSKAGAERLFEQFVDTIGEDPEAAASLERALWMRVLAEASHNPNSGQTAPLAVIALRTALYDFPRWR